MLKPYATLTSKGQATIPKAIRNGMQMKTSDEVQIVATRARRFEIGRDRSREQALERLRALKKPLPKGCRFDREEANAR